MRAVYFVDRLQWDVPGNVFKHGMTIGDVDNDGDNELIVGTAEGELYIFKGTEIWHKTSGLGMITCVAVGDIFNYGRNALVVVCGDGNVHIFYGPRSANPSQLTLAANLAENLKIGGSDAKDSSDQMSGKIECVHVQQILPNVKVILIGDIDQDGANEIVVGLTDRVVRSYRWSSTSSSSTGKLVCLNKWESANQIGTITLQHMSDGTPTLLVGQPGGTFMRIKCTPIKPDDSPETKNETTVNGVDYQTLGISRMRNPNISTEIIGNLEPGMIETFSKDSKTLPGFSRIKPQTETKIESDDSQSNSPGVDQVDGNVLGGNVILGKIENEEKKSVLPTYKDFSPSSKKISSKKDGKEVNVDDNVDDESKEDVKISKPYALATLDGTILLVKDEVIVWALQVDHQIFALSRLDVTGDGSDEIVACAWDGQTYFLDQEKRSVRFLFEEPVRSFCTGYYSLTPGTLTPSLVYSTFSNKIFLYYDVVLPSMVAMPFDPNDFMSPDEKTFVNELIGDCSDAERDKKMQHFTEYLLYGIEN